MDTKNIPSERVLTPRINRIRAIQELYESVNNIIIGQGGIESLGEAIAALEQSLSQNYYTSSQTDAKITEGLTSLNPTEKTAFDSPLVDNTIYTITDSGVITLPTIPDDNSKGIIIHFMPPAGGTGITALDYSGTLQWYNEVPTISMAAGEHWVMTILDGICAIGKVVSQ